MNVKQKLVLRELVDFHCQECGRSEDKCGILEFHRIKRGNAGGKYVPNNLMIICSHCHKLIHYGEFK